LYIRATLVFDPRNDCALSGTTEITVSRRAADEEENFIVYVRCRYNAASAYIRGIDRQCSHGVKAEAKQMVRALQPVSTLLQGMLRNS
jgi:hypothetical protein